jgi:hypothetical protein
MAGIPCSCERGSRVPRAARVRGSLMFVLLLLLLLMLLLLLLFDDVRGVQGTQFNKLERR